MAETKLTGTVYKALFKAWRAMPEWSREAIYSNRVLNSTKAVIRDLAANFAGRDDIYNSDYYKLVDEMTVRSAAVMRDSILRDLAPRTITDVGCGTGAVLAAFRDVGITGYGLEYSEAGLEFCRRRHLAVDKFDLTQPRTTEPSRSDVVISMEVAEHIAAEFADTLVQTITSFADTVVFTAAVPGQGGGTDHVNEQPHEYWIQKFVDSGFRFRSTLSQVWASEWEKKGVAACYWSNVMVFQKDGNEAIRQS